jgi:hypothetical protein
LTARHSKLIIRKLKKLGFVYMEEKNSINFTDTSPRRDCQLELEPISAMEARIMEMRCYPRFLNR